MGLGLAVLQDLNWLEFVVREATQFRSAAADAPGSPSNDILCDSILEALEQGTNDASTRREATESQLDSIACRVTQALQEKAEDVRPRDVVMPHGVTRSPMAEPTKQEQLLLTVNDVLFWERDLLVMPYAVRRATRRRRPCRRPPWRRPCRRPP